MRLHAECKSIREPGCERLIEQGQIEGLVIGSSLEGHRSTDKAPGDNELISPKDSIDGGVWHLDVGSRIRGCPGSQGWAVAPIKAAREAEFRTS